MNDVHTTFADQGLVRPRDGRVIAGVCAGLGRRFGFGPWTARLLFVLVLLVVPGSQLSGPDEESDGRSGAPGGSTGAGAFGSQTRLAFS